MLIYVLLIYYYLKMKNYVHRRKTVKNDSSKHMTMYRKYFT